MAKAPPKLLTRRYEAHRLLSWLARMQIRYAAWKDARAVDKAQRKFRKRPGGHQ